MNKTELRELFEEDMKKRFQKKPVSFARDKQGMYLDKTTRNYNPIVTLETIWSCSG